MEIATIGDVRCMVLPLMDGFPAPWCVAGGWAIDLFLGRVTRAHADVELAVFRQDQLMLQHQFRGWRFEKVIDSRRAAWAEGERLELPVHEIHARRADGSPAAIEFLLNERDAGNWAYRRNTSIRMPIARSIVPSSAGLPVLAPEIVLLFKSKSLHERDAADLASTLPTLGAERRRWLMRAVATADPAHPWLRVLSTTTGGDA